MSKLYYPAVFHKEESGFWVEFPDLPGCFTDGITLKEAYENAKEVLGIYLEKDNDLFEREFSEPSDITELVHQYPDCLVQIIEYDSVKYARKYKTKAIKKTLSIPEWLNEAAVNKGINFSQVLQEALIAKLNILD